MSLRVLGKLEKKAIRTTGNGLEGGEKAYSMAPLSIELHCCTKSHLVSKIALIASHKIPHVYSHLSSTVWEKLYK